MMPPIAQRPISLGRCTSSVSGMKTFSSPRQSEMLWWQPLAETPMKGFGMKHGKAPSSRPTALQICRKVERLSAVFSARSKPKLSSSWPGASSWSPQIMSSPMCCPYSTTLWMSGWSSANWSMW